MMSYVCGSGHNTLPSLVLDRFRGISSRVISSRLLPATKEEWAGELNYLPFNALVVLETEMAREETAELVGSEQLEQSYSQALATSKVVWNPELSH